MATTKIQKVRDNKHVHNSLSYIVNENKTDNSLITTFGVRNFSFEEKSESINFILNDFEKIQNLNNLHMIKARHLIQSFAPNEVDKDTAHQIGVELCSKLLQDNFQYILVTHKDKNHIHNHIIFNNVGINNMCFYDSKNMYEEIQKISDGLCEKYKLSVIENKNNSKKYVNTKIKNNISNRDELKEIIDKLLKDDNVKNLDDLAEKLNKDYNCEVKYKTKDGKGFLKNISVKLFKAKRFIRLNSLGDFYKTDNIVKILKLSDRSKIEIPKREKIKNSKLNLKSTLKEIATYIYSIFSLNKNINKKNTFIPKNDFIKITRENSFLIKTQKRINFIKKTSLSTINLKYTPEDFSKDLSQRKRDSNNNMQHFQAVYDIINSSKQVKFYTKYYEFNYKGSSFNEKENNIKTLLESGYNDLHKLKIDYVKAIYKSDKRQLKKLERIINYKLKEVEKLKKDLNTFKKAKQVKENYKLYSHTISNIR